MSQDHSDFEFEFECLDSMERLSAPNKEDWE